MNARISLALIVTTFVLFGCEKREEIVAPGTVASHHTSGLSLSKVASDRFYQETEINALSPGRSYPDFGITKECGEVDYDNTYIKCSLLKDTTQKAIAKFLNLKDKYYRVSAKLSLDDIHARTNGDDREHMMAAFWVWTDRTIGWIPWNSGMKDLGPGFEIMTCATTDDHYGVLGYIDITAAFQDYGATTQLVRIHVPKSTFLAQYNNKIYEIDISPRTITFRIDGTTILTAEPEHSFATPYYHYPEFGIYSTGGTPSKNYTLTATTVRYARYRDIMLYPNLDVSFGVANYKTTSPFQRFSFDNFAFADGTDNGRVVGERDFTHSDGITDTYFLWDELEPGDIPLSGKGCVGYYRPSARRFRLDTDLNGVFNYAAILGDVGDRPVLGDWDGDGFASPGLFRPSTHTFWLYDDELNCVNSIVFGCESDIPIAGNWDGSSDHKEKVGVYRPGGPCFDHSFWTTLTTQGTGVPYHYLDYGMQTTPPGGGDSYAIYDCLKDYPVIWYVKNDECAHFGAYRVDDRRYWLTLQTSGSGEPSWTHIDMDEEGSAPLVVRKKWDNSQLPTDIYHVGPTGVYTY